MSGNCLSSIDRIEGSLGDLVKSIGNGSFKDAEQAAKYLAKNRAKVYFHLTSARDVDDGKSSKKSSGSAAEASVDVLEFVFDRSYD